MQTIQLSLFEQKSVAGDLSKCTRSSGVFSTDIYIYILTQMVIPELFV